MSNDIEANEYDVGTTSIRLIRVGNLIQILFSNPHAAKFLYKELIEKYKRDQDQFRGT